MARNEVQADRKKREQREDKERKKIQDVRLKKGEAAAVKEAKKLADARDRSQVSIFVRYTTPCSQPSRFPLPVRQQNSPVTPSSPTQAKQFFRVTVRDNGAGMPHDDIPSMLGRVLSGTKYGVKQTRGKFGLGAKMALLWSKMSTGLPFDIKSSRSPSSAVSVYRLDIDVHRNEPSVLLERRDSNEAAWRGSEVSVVIEGSWIKYRARVLRYLRQIAVITPYAQFQLEFKGVSGKGSLKATFKRRTDKMPLPPKDTKVRGGGKEEERSSIFFYLLEREGPPFLLPSSLLSFPLPTLSPRSCSPLTFPTLPSQHHPAAVDLETLSRILQSTKQPTLLQMLSKEFDCVSKSLAERICHESRVGVDPDMGECLLMRHALA